MKLHISIQIMLLANLARSRHEIRLISRLVWFYSTQYLISWCLAVVPPFVTSFHLALHFVLFYQPNRPASTLHRTDRRYPCLHGARKTCLQRLLRFQNDWAAQVLQENANLWTSWVAVARAKLIDSCFIHAPLLPVICTTVVCVFACAFLIYRV